MASDQSNTTIEPLFLIGRDQGGGFFAISLPHANTRFFLPGATAGEAAEMALIAISRGSDQRAAALTRLAELDGKHL
jgi:hypothetical protein